jgi:hypothetical protein
MPPGVAKVSTGDILPQKPLILIIRATMIDRDEIECQWPRPPALLDWREETVELTG